MPVAALLGHLPAGCPPCTQLPQDLSVTVILRCALARVQVLNQEDEGKQVGRAQGAGTVAVGTGEEAARQCLLGTGGERRERPCRWQAEHRSLQRV